MMQLGPVMRITSFRDLQVWQRAMVLAEKVYARRTGHYLYHLNVASGSDAELQTQLELAFRLGLVESHRIDPLLQESAEIGRMLRGLASAVACTRRTSNSVP